MIRKLFKRLSKITLALIIGIGLVMFLSNLIVNKSSKDEVYNNVSSIPKNKVGLMLGTSKFIKQRWINLYYKYRIDAAVALYKAGKVEFILISGDNSRKEYDEPSTMKDDLVARGIPASKIFLDYAGFRTLDSVVRCKEIFGQEKITVISQEFHNQRAIFIAKRKGIDAVGYNARDVGERYGFKVKIREKFARVKLMIDLVFGVQPKFLGEKIEIGE